jgi:CheY-like chemotaxis protein
LPNDSPEAQDGPLGGDTAAVRRILVVDDEENVALTLQSGLEKLPNCEVAIATSGEEALLLFAQQPFDLMVTDYKMPGTDGMTLAARIRQAYPPTSIVMITAYTNDDLREQAASIYSILDKPVKLAQVRSAALEALGQAEADRSL